LTNTGSALRELAVTNVGTVVTWSRSGSGPEVSHVTFEFAFEDGAYTALGNGTRVSGGWQLTAQSLPANQNLSIRARGYYPTGAFNGSGSVVESIRTVHVSYANDALTSGVTVIRAVHVTELRARIDSLRLRYKLLPFSWTDASLGGVVAKAVHILELRAALHAAYVAADLVEPPSYTTPTLTPQQTFISAVHIIELRDAVGQLENPGR
jgi:hypothetical protein